MYNRVKFKISNKRKGAAIHMVKYGKIKGKMAEKGLTLRELADLTGIKLSTLSNKLNGQTEFKVSEIQIISKILGIKEIESYFFGK